MDMDPFDIIWCDVDPKGREIRLLRSVVDQREKANVHTGDEYLDYEDIREVVTDPERIDVTTKSPQHREIYYRTDEDESKQLARVVVAFQDEIGVPISWSRYDRPVSYLEVVYEKTEKEK